MEWVREMSALDDVLNELPYQDDDGYIVGENVAEARTEIERLRDDVKFWTQKTERLRAVLEDISSGNHIGALPAWYRSRARNALAEEKE